MSVTEGRLRSVDGQRWCLPGYMELESDAGALYLRRWRLIETPWFSVKLHHIVSADADRALHDHPWSFLSLILRGGYSEITAPWPKAVADGALLTTGHERWAWHRMRAEDLHRITSVYGPSCWTLVFCGPRRREWGFVPYDTGEWVPWNEYPDSGRVRRKVSLLDFLRRRKAVT